LPPGAALGQADPTAPATGLMPIETAAMTRAIPARMREFAAGRRAARAAMLALGRPPGTVSQGTDRAPIWPKGITGTLSHGGGACIALVASTQTTAGLGLDLEPAETLPADLLDTVCTPVERLMAARDQSGLLARMIFCAKEASYKAQYPQTRQILDFHDLEIDFDGSGDRFITRLRRPCAPFRAETRWAGQILVKDSIVAALVILPQA
uniref:4'-phosphopantetheinyl transferase family protein n=1 Tax=uncultured Roseovarius sp. TaxID=293344 RepID=UPI0026261A5F